VCFSTSLKIARLGHRTMRMA